MICFLIGLTSQGCSSSPDMACYKKAISSGVKTLKWPSEMEKWYGKKDTGVDHFITHFGFDASSPVVWNSVVYLHDRYVLTLQVKVKVDYNACKVVGPVGPMTFFVDEIVDVKILPNGQVSSRDGQQKTFSATEWSLLEKKSGELDALPMVVLKSSPTPGFEDFRRAWRKDLK